MAPAAPNVAAPPGDRRGETTVFRIWPAGESGLSYRFPRDISSWCRSTGQSPSASSRSVSFPCVVERASPRPPTTGAGVCLHPSRPAEAYTCLVRLQADRVPTGEQQGNPKRTVSTSAPPRARGGHREPRRESQRIAISGDRAAAHFERRRRDRHGPAATYRDGRVADRRIFSVGGDSAEAAGSGRVAQIERFMQSRGSSAWDDGAQRACSSSAHSLRCSSEAQKGALELAPRRVLLIARSGSMNRGVLAPVP